MIEEKLTIPALDVEALFFRHEAPSPGILFLTDIWGIRPANIAMAKRLSEKGFAVLMPNVFFRYSKIRPNGFEPEDASEKMPTLHRIFPCLTRAQMMSDGAEYVNFLQALKGVAAQDKVGVIGYCFTGQMAC